MRHLGAPRRVAGRGYRCWLLQALPVAGSSWLLNLSPHPTQSEQSATLQSMPQPQQPPPGDGQGRLAQILPTVTVYAIAAVDSSSDNTSLFSGGELNRIQPSPCGEEWRPLLATRCNPEPNTFGILGRFVLEASHATPPFCRCGFKLDPKPKGD